MAPRIGTETRRPLWPSCTYSTLELSRERARLSGIGGGILTDLVGAWESMQKQLPGTDVYLRREEEQKNGSGELARLYSFLLLNNLDDNLHGTGALRIHMYLGRIY